MCCRYPLFATSGYILTPTSVCEHMSPPPSDRALQHIRQIRSVRRCLPQHALLTLIRALLWLSARSTTAVPCWPVSPVIYSQAAVHPQRCRPTRVLSHCQAASERVTPLLRDLHWLRVPERIQFRFCVLAFMMSQWISAAISR